MEKKVQNIRNKANNVARKILLGQYFFRHPSHSLYNLITFIDIGIMEALFTVIFIENNIGIYIYIYILQDT